MIRSGKFTSSAIHVLTTLGSRDMTALELADWKKLNPKSVAKTTKDGFGTAALTYIEVKRREILLQRGMNKETNTRPTSWGNIVEPRVHQLLGTEYVYHSDLRVNHSEYPAFWSGAADLTTETSEGIVADIKCPYSLDVYTEKADIFIANDVQKLKKLYPENYWQLVSNSILFDKKYAELIIYCPYIDELIEIKSMVQDWSGDANEVAWLNWASDGSLPYLIKGAYYRNLYKLKWEVSAEDKEFLTNRVKMAIDKIKEGCV
jgi:hypothetical protein